MGRERLPVEKGEEGVVETGIRPRSNESARYEYARKPKKCPACGSSRVATILWGMRIPSERESRAIDAGIAVLGGCCLTGDDPKWTCSECGVPIYPKTKRSA
jgi:ribosomal protein L37E